MTDIWEAITAWASAFWEWIASLYTWLMSLFPAWFTAGYNWLRDIWIDGLEWATARAIGRLVGIDLGHLPTLQDLLGYLPEGAQGMLVAIGAVDALQTIGWALGVVVPFVTARALWRLAFGGGAG